jgi:putative DNA methylase
MSNTRLIETDRFPFEFISQLAERESWRKEVHRPVYYVHKWWAKRLGSVFRGILLGSVLDCDGDLVREFHETHELRNLAVLDPFMGSAVTIGEAHKLGMIAFGRDINPVASAAASVALSRIQKHKLDDAFKELSQGIGRKIGLMYKSSDSGGLECEVLYYFWVMQAACPSCRERVDLFPSYVISANAYPERNPEIQILCSGCGDVFAGRYGERRAICRTCSYEFNPTMGNVKGAKAKCGMCQHEFKVIDTFGPARPSFRLYAKLVLTAGNKKEYLRVSEQDIMAFRACSDLLEGEIASGNIVLPELRLEDGNNTTQAMKYGFKSWRDFFNDRQLLILGWLHKAISELPDAETRRAMLTLFSGVLEFNNMFASYKGEGTGAVRHMFSHHILKPERTPIEANIWGTSKSSGSFSGLYRTRLLRAAEYQESPTELAEGGGSRVCSHPFSGEIKQWPAEIPYSPRAIYLSCGDSAELGLPSQSLDLVVTDPPFFNNVHYSELADFFYSWQQLVEGERCLTTRRSTEVQDSDADKFADKLENVFKECHRVLKDDGLLVFTYHHSRADGWRAVAEAVLGAGFALVNAHPVKAEMSVATPKAQAKEPINFDMIMVCRKACPSETLRPKDPLGVAVDKMSRLTSAGFSLSENDRKVILYGQAFSNIVTDRGIDSALEAADLMWRTLGGNATKLASS